MPPRCRSTRPSNVATLSNGLEYYIRPNERPQDRAELRLVVKAGSILEDEDQRGLAHFVEHMAFNGTENYAENELIDYLQSTGARFGPDLNAYTSFDETVYMLQVRTDSADMFDKGLGILRDWAGGITFDPAEIDKERGVVLSEWRSGLGAQERLRDKTLPVTFANSRYVDRLPIGDTMVLKRAPYDALERFYRDWYRPDLMAVIVVGDVEPAAVEAQVEVALRRSRQPRSAARKDRVRGAVLRQNPGRRRHRPGGELFAAPGQLPAAGGKDRLRGGLPHATPVLALQQHARRAFCRKARRPRHALLLRQLRAGWLRG